MRVLKYTSVIEYIDGDTGEVLTANDVRRHYVIIKKTKEYEYTTKVARDTKEVYKECKVINRKFCTRHGKQLTIAYN